jgi:hypothetical protein
MFDMDASDSNTVRREKQAAREARKAETDVEIGAKQVETYQKEGDIRTYLGASSHTFAASGTEGEDCGCPNPPCNTVKNNWYNNGTVAAQTKGPHRDVRYLYNFADKTPGYWLDVLSSMFLAEAIIEIGFGVGMRFANTGVGTISNSVPSRLARVIPAHIDAKTLGALGVDDVFVTAADDILGLNAKQISKRLTIPYSKTGYKVIEFDNPVIGLASPINRTNVGFVGFGRTAGGSREFLIPNQVIPITAKIKVIK